MKLYLAGNPYGRHLETLRSVGARYVVFSYCRDGREVSLEDARTLLAPLRESGCDVLVDGGADALRDHYEFLDPRPEISEPARQAVGGPYRERIAAGRPVDVDACREELRQYRDRYLRWVLELRPEKLFAAWGELDIDPIFGMEIVREGRNLWRSADLQDGLIVTVRPPRSGLPDDSSTDQDLQDALSGQYGAVGVAGSPRDLPDWLFSRHMGDLRRNRIRVHAWATPYGDHLQDLPLASADSSVWASASRWGALYFFNVQTGRLDLFEAPRTDDRKARNRIRMGQFEQRGLLPELEDRGLREGLEEWRWGDVDTWNALQWARLQAHLDQDVRRAYWLDEADRTVRVEVARQRNGSERVLERLTFREMAPGDARALQVGRYCSTCAVQELCPEYRADSACNLSQVQRIGQGEGTASVRDIWETAVALQFDRVQFGALMERLRGGHLTKEVTDNQNLLMKMLEAGARIANPTQKVQVSVTASGPAVQPAPTPSRPQPGVLSKLLQGVLGSLDAPGDPVGDVIDVTPPKGP